MTKSVVDDVVTDEDYHACKKEQRVRHLSCQYVIVIGDECAKWKWGYQVLSSNFTSAAGKVKSRLMGRLSINPGATAVLSGG